MRSITATTASAATFAAVLRQTNRRLVVAFRIARFALQVGENPRAFGRIAIIGRIPAVLFVVVAAVVVIIGMAADVFCCRTGAIAV